MEDPNKLGNEADPNKPAGNEEDEDDILYGLKIPTPEEMKDITDEQLKSLLYEMDTNALFAFEPHVGMKFESQASAYTFYQKYEEGRGFKVYIDPRRIACSRFRKRRVSDDDDKNEPGTIYDCKACMQVEENPDGKWVIVFLEKNHSHLVEGASELTKAFDTYTEKVNFLLQSFTGLQNSNPNFLYAVGADDDARVKNLLWIDGKSRDDYRTFNDVVSFDTICIRKGYKMPLVLFVGVNRHYQFILLGCALVSDGSSETFSWVMRTWLKAMCNQAPKLIITDLDPSVKAAVSEVFSSSRHCLGLGELSEKLRGVVVRENEKDFMAGFEGCIHGPSWTEDGFRERWDQLIGSFGVKENELIQSLYNDRIKWVPGLIEDGESLLGMSMFKRTESVNSLFDKYVDENTTVQEFVDQYQALLQFTYEEEANASSYGARNEAASTDISLRYKKQIAEVYKYTDALLDKFGEEMLGLQSMQFKTPISGEVGSFELTDHGTNQEYTIILVNEPRTQVSCSCHMFELRGFLCRHALFGLQFIAKLEMAPSQYVLKRWTREEVPYSSSSLFERVMKLCEEASSSGVSDSIVVSAFQDALKNCLENTNPSNVEGEEDPSQGNEKKQRIK